MKPDKEIIDEMLKHFEKLDIVKSNEIPDISLYMDQMTGFIDEKLFDFKREEDDKLLTKTMINNYAKNRLLPPPDKKKYSKDHVMLLVLIYFYKNVLSFADIEKLLQLGFYKYFNNGDDTLGELYDILVKLEESKKGEIVSDLKNKLDASSKKVKDIDVENESLEIFAFLSDMVMEVYFKQHLIEYALDILNKD